MVFPHLHPLLTLLVLTKMEQTNVPPYMHTVRKGREKEGRGGRGGGAEVMGEGRKQEGKGRICGALTMMWACVRGDGGHV